MREINAEETALVDKIKERGTLVGHLAEALEVGEDDLIANLMPFTVEYFQQGAVTVAIVNSVCGKSLGTSRHFHDDWKIGLPFNPEKGKQLAFVRAISAKRSAVPV